MSVISELKLSKPVVDTARPKWPIRIAVVGCGAIAQQMHLPVLAGHPDFELVALVDRDHSRATELAAGYGVTRVLRDASELSRDMIDAAVLATPPAFHAKDAIALMRRGVHVLVEKPMAMSLDDARQMVDVASESGQVLSVGFYRRLFPSIQLLRRLVQQRTYGRVNRFHVAGGGFYNWSAATLANMRRETAGGGVLIDFGAHMIDLMFAVFDLPVAQLAYRDNCQGGIEADCEIDLSLDDGDRPIPGRIELARLRNLGSYIRVECERADLEFQIADRFRVRVLPRQGVDQPSGDLEGHQPSSDATDPAIVFDSFWQGIDEHENWYATFAREYDDFAQAIRFGQPAVLAGASALRTDQFIEHCYSQREPLDEPWVTGGRLSHPPILPGWQGANGRPRVLVTGASGFIGARVAETLRLHEGCDVRAVVNNPANASRLARLDVEMVQADLCDQNRLAELVAGCDAVIHCAVGTAYGQPERIRRVTVDGTRWLGEAALAAGVQRFVHVSSMSIYGTDDDVPKLIEESYEGRASRSSNQYGWTKWQAERALDRLQARGLPLVILRPGRVYGPFGTTFVMNPIRAIAEKRFAWAGDPDVPSDLVYVDNVVAACLRACVVDLERLPGRAINVSSQSSPTWRDFYSRLAKELGYDLSRAPIEPRSPAVRSSPIGSLFRMPLDLWHATSRIVRSPEMKSLGRRILSTEPIGTLPSRWMEKYPAFERSARRLVRADDSLPVWQPNSAQSSPPFAMGSAGARLVTERMHRLVDHAALVTDEQALSLTAAWVRAARVVGS